MKKMAENPLGTKEPIAQAKMGARTGRKPKGGLGKKVVLRGEPVRIKENEWLGENPKGRLGKMREKERN